MGGEKSKSGTGATSDSPEGKKPYSKPNVTSESIYEVTALACGKTPGGGGNCTGHTGSVHHS